jgi:hypothetical protein
MTFETIRATLRRSASLTIATDYPSLIPMAMVLMEEEEILAIFFESMAKSLKEKEALILEGRLASALEAAVAAIISAKTRPGGGTSPEEEGSEAASMWLATQKDDAEREVWMVLLQIKVVNALVARLSMLFGAMILSFQEESR